MWCKPVLFAHLPNTMTPMGGNQQSLPVFAPWAAHADGSTVLVVDLPGVQSVRMAETLVHAGFRPVPLFNAVPGPEGLDDTERDNSARTAVDVRPIIEALEQATLRLREPLQCLSAAAPPAFLLDGDRRLGKDPRPGDFDNRSVSLPTDFPSATFLQARGVRRAIVVFDAQSRMVTGDQPATDLAHTLLRWQTAGITIFSCALDENLEGGNLQTIAVARPTWFRAIWHNALAVVGLRRNPMGGFGGELPVPSAG